MKINSIPTYIFSSLGGIIGGLIGYLYRPSAILVGQLSFKHVISRGKSLKGFDQVLIPTAEASFNYLLGGILIGVVAGFIFRMIFLSRK